MQSILEINTWEWNRLLGMLAYFYFTMAVVFGMLLRFSFAKSKKSILFNIHQKSAWMGLFAVIAHMLVLIIDHYEPYEIIEIVVPFAADYHPIMSGLGTISFFLFLLVVFSSDLWMKKLKITMWRRMHYLVFPAWLFTLLHAIFMGTDTSNPVIAMFYGATAGLLVFLTLLKLMDRMFVKKTVPQKNVITDLPK